MSGEEFGRLPLPPELSPRRPARGHGARLAGGSGGSRGSRLLTAVVGAMSLVVLFVSGFSYLYYNQLNGNVKYVSIGGHKVARTPADKSSAENILLVGSDSRDGATAAELAEAHTTADGGGINTDTIILAHLAPNNGPVTFVSFPRDSVVSIPGHDPFKINSAYAYGEADHAKNPAINGPTLLTQTVENLTGVHIDHFVMVNFFQFIDISNAIGGVKVCVDGTAKYDPFTGADFTKAGDYTLKGPAALAYVRQRHGLTNGDFGRIQRQQRFISALIKKVKAQSNPLTINAVLQKATKSLTADSGLNGQAMLKLVERFRGIDIGKIQFQTIPNDGSAYGYLQGFRDKVSYVKVEPAAVRAFVQNVVNPQAATAAPTVTALPADQVHVRVLNGAGIAGIAGKTGTSLQHYGFQVAGVGNTTHGVTTIRYNSADAGAATTLAKAVPGAVLSADSTVSAGTVTLVVGTNFTDVQDPAQATTTPTVAPPSSSSSASSSAPATSSSAPPTNTECGP